MTKGFIVFLLGAICIVFLVGGWFYMQGNDALSIRVVKVTGDYRHSDAAKIQSLVEPLASHSLLSVNLKAIQDSLLSLPWVKSASVSRVWPDKVVIHLTEKTAIARLNNEGLVDAEGMPFYPPPDTFPKQLPVFHVAAPQAEEMLHAYQNFSQILSPLGLHILELQLTSDNVWSMQLSNGMHVMLGSEQVEARFKRFVQVYNKIFKNKTAASVDLRYPHGLAVQW